MQSLPSKSNSAPRRKIAILGYGREGKSVLKFLQNRGLAQNETRRDAEASKNEVWVLDRAPKLKIPRGVRARLGKNYLRDLREFDLVFHSPGIPWNLPELRKARRAGVEFSSATKLFFDEINRKILNSKLKIPTIIGVTGTKGKGTTATLLYQILRAARKPVFLAGNIGKPALALLSQINKNSLFVLELSSFQLIDLEKSPHIAVVLMVTSEHLDWHIDLKEYVAAKANIVRFQSKNDFAVLAADYPTSKSYARMTKANVLSFSRRKSVTNGAFVKNGYFWFANGGRKEKICRAKALHIPGKHNWENAAAAIAAAKIIGVPNAVIAKAISDFKGLEHRLELVAKARGVRYYNDSYSTTPETACVAIEAFRDPKILILGGSSKKSDFRALGRVISKSKSVKAIIGIGDEWPRIKTRIHNKKIKIIEGCRNMKMIVGAAHAVAAPGDVVLLSPACASFGMFQNYADRGRKFKNLTKRLK